MSYKFHLMISVEMCSLIFECMIFLIDTQPGLTEIILCCLQRFNFPLIGLHLLPRKLRTSGELSNTPSAYKSVGRFYINCIQRSNKTLKS